MNKCIVEGRKDVCNAEDEFTISNLRSKLNSGFLLWSLGFFRWLRDEKLAHCRWLICYRRSGKLKANPEHQLAIHHRHPSFLSIYIPTMKKVLIHVPSRIKCRNLEGECCGRRRSKVLWMSMQKGDGVRKYYVLRIPVRRVG